MHAAETDVGAALGQIDPADELPVWIEDAYDVEPRLAHAPAAPEIAIQIHAKAVGRACGPRVDQHAALGELRSAHHVIGEDLARHRARLDDVEDRFVGREGEAVRLVDAFGDHADGARSVDPVYVPR